MDIVKQEDDGKLFEEKVEDWHLSYQECLPSRMNWRMKLEKSWRQLDMKSEWKKYTVQELIDLGMLDKPLDGNHGNLHPKESDYIDKGVPFIMANDLVDGVVDLDDCAFISEEQAKTLRKGFAKPGDVLLTHKATIGRTAIVPNKYDTIILTPQVTYYRVKWGIDNRYLKYYFDSPDFQSTLNNWARSGSTRAYLGVTAQHKLPVVLPPYCEQQKIANILEPLDRKIELNNLINDSLEQMGQTIFDKLFPNIVVGNNAIGEIITPKRGKSLLSKNAVLGKVPVIAGGLKPATYHNVANTVAPVLTISASGANAGYVSLWNTPIWASDSSFIDASMTKNVYFWYMLLKKRQEEIYNMQTGTGQPHIYPQHIAAMTIPQLDIDRINYFTTLVSPIFENIGIRKKENVELSSLRDWLLPMLINGQAAISD